MPELDEWLHDSNTIKTYQYTKPFEEARYDPFVALHTSGSTASPRPIVMTNGTMAALDTFQMIPSLGGRPTHGSYWSGTRIFVPFPLFHSAAISYILPLKIYCGWIVVLPPPVPMNAQIADLVHTYGNVQESAFPTSILIEISKNPAYLENLGRLDWVTYGGGPLSKEVGYTMSKHTRVTTMFGATEIGILPTEVTDLDDWQYLKYSPFLGHEFRPYGEGFYEHVIVRKNQLDLFQAVFATFPNLTEYSTKDLCSKHRSKSELWLFEGRTDDVIVYSNGSKFNPLKLEGIIAAHPAVTSALVDGNGRAQSALLVEPKIDMRNEDLLEEIWPTIQSANNASRAVARIAKGMVTFTSPEKPMLRAGKGTVRRRMTISLYREELDAVHAAASSKTRSPAYFSYF